MVTLVVLLVLVVAFAAFFAAPRFGIYVRVLLAATGIVGAAAICLLLFAPHDYLVRFPWTASIFHPYLVALYGGIGLVLFCGLALGLLVWSIYSAFQRRQVQHR